MPLIRFPDHEDKRVFLSTVLSLNLPAPLTAHSDRLSIAVFWADQDSTAARELNLDFAIDLIEHGALAIVCGGSAAPAFGALFERAIAEGEFVRDAEEEIHVFARPGATFEELLWTAAEEAMLPDAWADQPWDIVAWAHSGDPSVGRFRAALPRLTAIVEEIYDQGGDEA